MQINKQGFVRGSVALLILGAIFIITGCSSYAPSSTPAGTPSSTPPTSTSSTSTSGVTIDLTAQNISFDKKTITVPAGATVTVNFTNNDNGVPHNFALYKNSSAAPPAIFTGQIVTGPTSTTYTFTAPSTPGTYYFRCDVHPTQMFGDFIVQ